MSAKIIRDPLYNQISIDRGRDGWLVDVLDSPEVQRLRRIHQLGVSYLTYPGADHNRLAHSLGVLNLMIQAMRRLDEIAFESTDTAIREQIQRGRAPLLAAALIHDVGHGPFSHLFEPCLGIEHEVWSKEIILAPESGVHKALKKVDRSLPTTVAELIDKDNYEHPPWQKYLLSSQLDRDRLDYLRRDSLFTGASYGHFDWFRLINTFELHEYGDTGWDIVWDEKSSLAVEEYIFSRYYMYQNVYLHKTTRGFEKMLEAMWRRAKFLRDDGKDIGLVPVIRDFWSADQPDVRQYLAIEEFTVLSQIQIWASHDDPSLNDLARRFLNRDRFAMIEAPEFPDPFASKSDEWEDALFKLVGGRSEYSPPEMYCLIDRVKGKYKQPYFPEKEGDEQSVKNAIRIKVVGESRPVEVSELMPRLKPLTQEPVDRVRYYIPKDLQAEARRLRADWS